MADNVIMLRTVERVQVDPYAELQRKRTEMIGAWTAWLATQPGQGDVLQEIHGTMNAMRSLADLMAIGAGRRK